MQDSPVPFYELWLQTSGFDELSLISGVGSPNTGCFLAQQMAEKLLKALLAFLNDEFPKTHDLFVLSKRLENKGLNLESIVEDLEYLNRFYSKSRYPDELQIFSQQEAARAFDSAKRIKAFVMSKIKK